MQQHHPQQHQHQQHQQHQQQHHEQSVRCHQAQGGWNDHGKGLDLERRYSRHQRPGLQSCLNTCALRDWCHKSSFALRGKEGRTENDNTRAPLHPAHPPPTCRFYRKSLRDKTGRPIASLQDWRLHQLHWLQGQRRLLFSSRAWCSGRGLKYIWGRRIMQRTRACRGAHMVWRSCRLQARGACRLGGC